jgi:general secretion pathway protein M
MRTLTARERRLVAIGILVLIVAVAWLGVIMPVVGGFAERAERRAELETQYARNARIIDSIRIWKHQAEAQNRDARRYAFSAANATLAATFLQQHVVGAVHGVGGSVQVSGPETATSSRSVVVRADAELTMSQLYEFLRRLESGEPHVVVEYFSVSADRAFQSGHVDSMDVRLRVRASYRQARPQ